MNRRGLLKGVAGLTAGLVLPASVAENAAEAKRYWALGAMPGKELPIIARAGDCIVMEMGGLLSPHAMTLTLKRADGGPDVVVFQGDPPLFGSMQIPTRRARGQARRVRGLVDSTQAARPDCPSELSGYGVLHCAE